MNRGIKFRAYAQNADIMVYQKDFNEWIDGGMMEVSVTEDGIEALYQMHENFGEIMSVGNPPIYSTDDMVVLMQYTGLKDKHGKEIYEGDIYENPNGAIVKIYYNPDQTAYMGELINRDYDDRYIIGDDGVMKGEVIGNVFENSHLLEQTK